MSEKIKAIVKEILKKINIAVMRYSTYIFFQKNISASQDIEMLLTLPHQKAPEILRFLRKSKSQLRQDLFVLSELDFKKNGFFVEFGATNGLDLSNTHLLEKEFGWSGILAEPAKCWHKDLTKNRTAIIEKKCIWKDSKSTLRFNEVDAAELSTIDIYRNEDSHKEKRNKGSIYNVETISLNDLLLKHGAPNFIDYLSIDTEGSEFEILSGFDFSKYSFKIITCEHNFTPMREKICALLQSNGYVRVHQELSKFDDWFIKSD